MKLTKLALLIVIIVTLGMGAIVVTKYNPSFRRQAVFTPPQPTPLEIAHAQLSLFPQITQLHVGDKGSFDVYVDPLDKKVIGIDGEFLYESKLIKVTGITAGTYFQKSDILYQKIDPAAGKISFSLGTLSPTAGKGILFSISFSALQATSGIGNVLSFDQAATKLAVENMQNKVFPDKQTALVFNEKPVSILP